ncbi:hypothetical protein K239x_47590 [Planctomycetes bacterium K23_9]|uniref:Uncharacterized protein n=1 Tax=Stieleria marina TaxID=1930275 RepID=A0A517P047_9BACT|nr:hypothetical protein K239x_47590 [Planctomycetes bacterium K23_9]
MSEPGGSPAGCVSGDDFSQLGSWSLQILTKWIRRRNLIWCCRFPLFDLYLRNCLRSFRGGHNVGETK